MDAEIISVLIDQYKKHPAQAKNLDAMISHINDGKPLPDATKSIFYAIDGKAGVASAAEYGNIIKETGATSPGGTREGAQASDVLFYDGIPADSRHFNSSARRFNSQARCFRDTRKQILGGRSGPSSSTSSVCMVSEA